MLNPKQPTQNLVAPVGLRDEVGKRMCQKQGPLGPCVCCLPIFLSSMTCSVYGVSVGCCADDCSDEVC